MQTNPAAEQNKNVKWSGCPYSSQAGGGKDLSKSQVLSSE